MTQATVVGLGNALMDALYILDSDDFLSQESLNKGTMHGVSDAEWQAVYAKIDASKVDLKTGGSAANTIATLGYLGASASYCGQVGDDAFGKQYAAQFDDACGQHGIHTVAGTPTGKCLALISPDGERTMLTDLGTAVNLETVQHISASIQQAKVLHLTGYLLLGEVTQARMMEAISMAKAAGVKVSLEVADPFVVALKRDEMLELIEKEVDIVFLNEEEAKSLYESTPQAAFDKLQSLVETVVVKLGKDGSMAARNGETACAGIYPANLIDTTGAGDSYAAGFLYGYVNGFSLEQSAQLAARVASACVSQLGAVVRDRELLAKAVAQTVAGE